MKSIFKNIEKKLQKKIKKNLVKKDINISEQVSVKKDNNLIKISSAENKYNKDKNYKMLVDYTKYYEYMPINEKVIFYESFHGKNMSDSPLAICKALIDNDEFKEYTHVWALNDANNLKEEFKDKKNIKVCKVNSNEYLKYISSAKYLINNTTFPPYFIRKKEQKYINTWHGTPLKTLGKDMKGSIGQHKNIQRNFLQATHLINPNKYTSNILIDSHDLKGLYSGYIANIGYPRIDLTLKCDKSKLKDKLKIEFNKKVLLYAPTWRGEVGSVDKDILRFISDYKRLQEEFGDEYKILLRVHSLMYKYLKQEGLEKDVVPETIDTNELLGIVDLLITDYSSIMFDYMVTRKPILFYTYDREIYEENRGTYLNLEDMPGDICLDIDSVIKSIKNIDEVIIRNKDKYKKCLKLYCYNDDGKATERAINLIFKDNLSNAYLVKNNKKNIIMYCGGFLNNGITASAVNLLNNIDYEKYNVAVIDKDVYDEESAFNFSKINNNVKKLYRVGSMNPLIEETDKQSFIFKDGLKRDFKEEELINNLYKRENRRLFGDTKFDIAIDFSGYVKFWTMVLASGNYNKKIIYQHNDMMAEYDKIVNGKFVHKSNLDIIFSMYNSFDTIVCVSQYTMKLNAEKLKDRVKNISGKICCVHNSINFTDILDKSKKFEIKKFDEESYFILDKDINKKIMKLKAVITPTNKNINFVNVGRLSPEKDQKKLIEAFYEVSKKYNNIKLYILGDGVLKNELETLVENLNLSNRVFILGQVKNPFAFINKCDCFVLSSNHEGQPMVLLEA